MDDWGDAWGSNKKADNLDDLEGFDYDNSNLNKLSNAQLERHKLKMDQKFSKNALKPGDPGYVYDKRVDFKEMPKEENSWDEGDEDDYFDDDFS